MSAVLLAAAVGGNRELAPERQQCGRDRELEGCRPPTATAAKLPSETVESLQAPDAVDNPVLPNGRALASLCRGELH